MRTPARTAFSLPSNRSPRRRRFAMLKIAAPTLQIPVNEHDHIRGPTDAPVTLVEYGDYECPHCGRAFPVLEDMRVLLGDSLRLVFRHYPINLGHSHAQLAAEAAEAAGAQGRFWDMHAKLFTNQ